MPIIDHIEKIVAPNSSGVTIPYTYNPGALNRYVLVLAMACHPDNTLVINPFSPTAQYAGLELANPLTGRSLDEPGTTVAWCAAYSRSLLLGEQPLSGDVEVAVNTSQNIVAYVIGFRGVGSFPYYWDRVAGNHGPSTAVVSVLNNPYLAITALAIKNEAIVSSVSGDAEIIEQETISDGFGSITGTLVLAPLGQNLTTCFLSGNAALGRIGWVPYADVDQGEDVVPPEPEAPLVGREPFDPYFKHEIRARTGIRLP